MVDNIEKYVCRGFAHGLTARHANTSVFVPIAVKTKSLISRSAPFLVVCKTHFLSLKPPYTFSGRVGVVGLWIVSPIGTWKRR